MGTTQQQPEAFTDADMKEVKPKSKEKDKKRGYDTAKGTKDGKDVSYSIFDKPPKNRKLIYVKKPDGSFKFSPRPDPVPGKRTPPTLPHSMLGGGDKVIGAGECETDGNGKITKADNQSGHYQPGEKNLKETKKNMEKQGLSTPETKWEKKF
jgi:hypothetical protein